MFDFFFNFKNDHKFNKQLTYIVLFSYPEVRELPDELEKVSHKSFYTKLNIFMNKSTLFSSYGTTNAYPTTFVMFCYILLLFMFSLFAYNMF